MGEKWSPFGGAPKHGQAIVNSLRGRYCSECGKLIEVGVRVYRERPPKNWEGLSLGLPGQSSFNPKYRHAECPTDN